MKIVPLLVATTFAAAVAAAPVMAQSQQSDEGYSAESSQMNKSDNMNQDDYGQRGRNNGWGRDSDGRGGQENRGWMNGEGGHAWMRHRGMGGGWHRDDRTRGAKFIFKRGNEEIRIRCPVDESINVCVNAAGRLINKLDSMDKQGAGQSNPAPSASPNSPNNPKD